MKRSLFLAAALFGLSQTGLAVPTPIYSVLTDKGIAGETIYVWGPGLGNSVTLSSTSTNPPPPEGIYSMKGQAVSGNGSTWAIFYLDGLRANRPVDLSAYASSGELRFWANCDTANFFTFLQYPDGAQAKSNWSATSLASHLNQWVSLAIPLNTFPAHLSPTPLSNIVSPFGLTMNQSGTCYIDNIRYVNPPSPLASVFNVAVKDIATQSVASGLTWPGGLSPTGWERSNQYIELELDDLEDLSWGVQIYTNNASAAANPKYSGSGSLNPAGLVNPAIRSITIPLAWSVKAGTQTPTAAMPTAAEPNNSGDNNSFQWIYMKDAMTPNIPSQNTAVFVPGELPVTVKNNVGIHYGQRDTDFGAENPPNYIFLEANFGAALAQQSYQTNTLTVEYFSL